MKGPKLAIIVPTYKHPVLLAEALDSALSQQTTFPFVVVVCSDGCPFVETDTIGAAFNALDPRIIYLRKPNGGPSSARNFAIRFALTNFASLEAVYFLDSDNRLGAFALETGYRALVEDPDVDWVYPSIDTFGISWAANYAIPYSPLLHVIHENFCDTGSFVSRKLLEAGVRFDESALNGYEDWDFWLQALSLGFRGKHVPFGFSYRQRPESRFREMNRLRGAMTERLRQRHARIASPRNLLRWEHEGNPRYLFVDEAADAHSNFTDPAAPAGSIDVADFEASLWAAQETGDQIWTPAFYLFGSRDALEALRSQGLVHNALFLLEREAARSGLAALTLQPRQDAIGVEIVAPSDDARPQGQAHLWMASHRAICDLVIADEAVDWLRERSLAPACSLIGLSAPFADDLASGAGLEMLRRRVSAWRNSDYRAAANRRWPWRPRVLPRRSEYYDRLCQYFEVSAITPRAPASGLDIGFIVPIASYGGAEKVGYALAQALRRAGVARTHLFVFGQPRMKLVPEFEAAFDTINFLADAEFPVWGGGATMFGQPIFLPGSPELRAEKALGLLLGLDLVINCQSAPANSLMGALRKLKVKTMNYVHLIDYSKNQRPVGHAHIAVGFEHAYDLLVTCSRRLASEMHFLGAPAEKIMAIPNAASFRISERQRADAAKRRARPRRKRKLRCLYLGRLDHQKGVERLYALVRSSLEEGLAVEFRMVGSSLVEESRIDWSAVFADMGIAIEKPVFDSGGLAELYGWADVLLLPSRWEGAPLVIPECQQLGCIPISADVGAVDELIDDGVDGLLVSSRDDAELARDIAAHIRRLLADDQERRRIAAAAIERGRETQWETNFAPLVAWIEANLLTKSGEARAGETVNQQRSPSPAP